MADSNAEFENRPEVPYLERHTSLRQLKDVALLTKLRDHIQQLNSETNSKYAIGEWYTHKGLETAVQGHGIYVLEETKKLLEEFGAFGNDPFFSVATLDYLDKK